MHLVHKLRQSKDGVWLGGILQRGRVSMWRFVIKGANPLKCALSVFNYFYVGGFSCSQTNQL